MTSLENLPDQPSVAPSSPRSLLAFKKASIAPQDIIYHPLQYYELKYPDPRIARVHYDKAELQRQQDVGSVLQQYRTILAQGISEAEFYLMGQPSQLKQLVGKFSKEKELDGSAMSRATEIAEKAISRSLQREAEVEEFLDRKAKERALKADEASRRLRELEQLQAEKIEQQRKEMEIKNKAYQEARDAREQAMKQENERMFREQQEKMKIVEEKVAGYKLQKSIDAGRNKEINDMRRSQAIVQFKTALQIKEEKQKMKQMEEERKIEENKKLQAEIIEQQKQKLEQKFVESKIKMEQFEKEVEKRKQLQQQAVEKRQQKAAELIESERAEKVRKLREQAEERVKMQESFKEMNAKRELEKRKHVEEKNTKQKENFTDYYNTVLIVDKLKQEQKKIDQDNRRKQAQRQVEQAMFVKQQKSLEMKKKLEIISQEKQAQEEQINAIIAAKAKIQAKKQLEEMERVYYKKEKRCQSQTNLVRSNASTM
ncbi:Conserved_hypothetical protein [Hexamita inflata]|uniref:Uncharacterized protein n=1 Tax=Hexamita inflata TaxID=28002 RepID=A0AA86UI07_9EUKA|nr:Conserved hypothetical protein [Hexamita inflata]